MEQIAAVQPAAPVMEKGSLRGLLGGAGIPDDAFAAIFQQLLASGQEDMFAQVLSQAEEDGIRNGMQLAAEFLCGMPGSLPQAMEQLPGQAALTPVLPNGRQSTALPFPVEQAEGEASADQAVGQAAQGKDRGFYRMLQGSWEEQPQPVTGRGFLSEQTVREARRLLNGTSRQEPQAADIERLQADVDAGRFIRGPAAQKQDLPIPSAQEIAHQLKTGILQNAAKGKNEFVVRLKPEGLGEITVKLSEGQNKISLSIITSSPQAAKMITDEVAVLQNALRPLHAEVQQVITTAGHDAAYASQNSLAGQSQQQAGRQFAGHEPRAPYYGEDGDFDGLMQEVLLPDGELDTYI